MKTILSDVIDDSTPLEFGRWVEQRPRLFLTPDRLAFLRTAAATEPYAGYIARVRAFADSILDGPDDVAQSSGDKRKYGCVLPHMALIYLLTESGPLLATYRMGLEQPDAIGIEFG